MQRLPGQPTAVNADAHFYERRDRARADALTRASFDFLVAFRDWCDAHRERVRVEHTHFRDAGQTS